MNTTTLPRCPVCGFEHDGPLPAACARPSCGIGLLPGTAERCRTGTFRLVDHYSICVLPFTFAEAGADAPPLPERLTAAGRWKERAFSLDNPDDVDRTEYFLPYTRRFLFPSLFAPQPTDGEPEPQKPTCWHFDFELTRLGKVGDGGLALTLRGQDTRKKLNVEQPLVLESVRLVVFGYRVGFLILRFRNTEPGATYFDQMEALTYLRTIAPLYREFEMPELATETSRFRIDTLLPYLLAEFGTGGPPAVPAAQPTPLPVRPTYDDRMMVYAFSCLEKETALPEQKRCESLLDRGAVVHLESSREERPTNKLEPGADAWLQSRWQSFNKDGGMLVVFNTDRYHSRFIGVYHGTYYFDIFLLAALQRVTLLALYDRFSNIHELIRGTRAGRKLLRRVRRDLLLFKNQCSFSQITNRERGLVLWKQWQKVFETRTLLREVNEQSEELDNYLQARYRERLEWLVRIGGFVVAAVPVIFGLEQILGDKEWVVNLRWILLGSLVAVAGVCAYLFVIRHDDGE
jgi:hypothetical protein